MVQSTFFSEGVTVHIPHAIDSIESFRAWYTSDEAPESGRCAFIQGEFLVDMSPENLFHHNQVKRVIDRDLDRLIDDGDLGIYLPDGMLITNVAADVSNEPDAAFVSWATLESGRVRIIPRADAVDALDSKELEGSPDWVCEVVSDSSTRKDQVQLRQAYFDAGVTEYWLIDGRGDKLRFDVLRRGEAGYEKTPTDGDGYAASAVFDRRFQLTRDRDRIGGWKYRLHAETPA